jgi:hypothetical protein
MLFLYENDLDSQETPASLETVYFFASQALEENPFNDTAYQVINWLEHTHDFHPDAPSTDPEQPAENAGQTAEPDDSISVEDQQEDLNQGGENQNNTIPYLLGAGLLAAVGVILVLVYKLGKKNAS